MKTYLFACVHNAGRSQMAAAWFNRLADPARARAISAGTQPGTQVHPEVREVMKEVGIDLTDARPLRLTDELARGATMLVTMGCGEACPVVPGLRRDDWPLEDPKGQPLARVREIREEVRQRVQDLVRRDGLAPGVGDVVTAAAELSYRSASSELRPALEDLLRSCTLPVEDLPLDLQHFVVATAGEQLVGCAGLDLLGEIALFRSLAVAPPWRGRGVARRLFEQTCSRAQHLGVRRLYLLTTSAQDLFARWGFTAVPRQSAPAAVQGTRQYRTLCSASAVVMSLDPLAKPP
jgi:arsenate reductase (thioredoxin)